VLLGCGSEYKRMSSCLLRGKNEPPVPETFDHSKFFTPKLAPNERRGSGRLLCTRRIICVLERRDSCSSFCNTVYSELHARPEGEKREGLNKVTYCCKEMRYHNEKSKMPGCSRETICPRERPIDVMRRVER
jgi:hypothetical protein